MAHTKPKVPEKSASKPEEDKKEEEDEEEDEAFLEDAPRYY